MKHTFRRSLVAAALTALATAPSAVLATNGYFGHGYGTKSKALAGAGVALSQDALASATNPAGMVFVGNRVDAGAALFSPRREYTVTGNPSGFPGTFGLFPGNVESDMNYFLIPHLGANWMLDDVSSFGVSVYGNGGMNTDYPGAANGGLGTYYGGPAGVDLAQLFIAPTYARKFGPNASWGVAPIIAYQRFEVTGLSLFGPAGGFGFNASTDPGNLSDRGHENSFGFGARVGVQGEVAPGVRLGASYQTKVLMNELDAYSGLFAEQGGFDIPPTATIGVAWNVTPKSWLLFDIQRIWFSEVASVGNPMLPALGLCAGAVQSGGSPVGNPNCLGGDNGPGFGYDDMTIYKLGYQWESSADWTWRVGVSYGEQPIPESEVLFNILAPAIMETHLTFGFTKKMGKSNELSFAGMYAPSNTVKGVNPMEVPGQQEIELKMYQFELEASWAWTF